MKGDATAWALMVACGSLSMAGCDRWSRDVSAFAETFVERARKGGVPDEAFDPDLADRARRVQLLKRVPGDRVSPSTLAILWRDSAPRSSVNERAQQYRARASAAIRATTAGTCRAAVDDELGATRLGLLTRSVPGAPAEANAEVESLAVALAAARVVRVRCDRGALGLVAVPRPSSPWWAAIDLFDAGESAGVEIAQ